MQLQVQNQLFRPGRAVTSGLVWAPASAVVFWLEQGGGFQSGDLAAFTANANQAKITNLDFNGTAITSISGLKSLPLLQVLDVHNCTSLASLDVSGCPSLTTLSCLSDAALASLNITNCPLLNSVQCQLCTSLTGVDFTGCNSMNIARFNNCAMGSAALDTALCSLATVVSANTLIGGTFNITTNAGIPSATGYACMTTLRGAPYLWTVLPAVPGLATGPSPANGATGVVLGNVLLSWTTGSDTTSWDVYVNGVFQSNVAVTHFSGYNFSTNNTTYTWRVDAKGPGGTTTGTTWSFTTVPAQNALVTTWLASIAGQGGAAPSVNTQAAVNIFANSLDSAGLTSKMKTLNCFVPDNLIACITPLIPVAGTAGTPWTNNNFTGAGGAGGTLSVNGLLSVAASSQYLDTQLLMTTSFADDNVGFSFYLFTNSAGGCALGNYNAAVSANQWSAVYSNDGVATRFDSFYNGGAAGRLSIAILGAGFFSANRLNAVDARIFWGNSGNAFAQKGLMNTQSGTRTAAKLHVFSNGGGIGFCSNTFSFCAAHVGLSLADSTALFNAVQALRTSLGGGFI